MTFSAHPPPTAQPERINLNDKAKAQAWTLTLGVSLEQLRRAIAAVGDTVANVKSYLVGHPQQPSSFDHSSFG